MSLKRNIVGNFLGQGWVAAMSLAFVPVYVAQLGVEAYGLIGFYAVLQAWLSLLDFGMTPTINREMARTTAGAHTASSIGDLMRSIEIVCFSLAVLVAASIWLTSDWLAAHWFSPAALPRSEIANAIAVMAFVAASRFCEGIYRGALFGMERQIWFNSVNAALATVRYGGAAIVVWLVPSIAAFFWWQALLSAISVAVFAAATHHWMPRASPPPRFSLSALKNISSFAGGLSLTTLLALMLTQFDKVLLSRLVSLEAFGHYMLAVAIAGVFPMLVGPVSNAIYPRLTIAVTDRDERQAARHFQTGSQLSALVLVPIAAVFVLLPGEVILAWTGDQTLAAEVGPILALISVGMLCNSILQIPFMLQLAHNWTSLSVKINSIAVLFAVPAIYVAVRQFGSIGAAAVFAALNIATLVAATIVMHRRLLPLERDRWIWQSLLAPLAATFTSVGLTIVLAPAPESRIAALAIVITAAAVGFSSAGLVLQFVRQQAVDGIRNLLRHARALVSAYTLKTGG